MNDTTRTSKTWLDEEALRLFTEWLGMNYGEKVFGDHIDHHARRIFSHANSVIVSRRPSEPPSTAQACMDFAAYAVRYVGYAEIGDWNRVDAGLLTEALAKARKFLDDSYRATVTKEGSQS